MFNLEEKIAEWRRLFAGIQSSEVLDELENHLREDIERQERLGLIPDEAFDKAVQQMDSPESLKVEFHKENERKFMKRILITTTEIVGVLIGMAFVMPALAQYRHTEALSNDEPWLFLRALLSPLAA